MALTFLEDLAGSHPSLADTALKCRDLYRKRLVHQLTDDIESLLSKVESSDKPMLVDWQLFNEKVLNDISEKMNLIRYAQIAIRMSNLLFSDGKLKSGITAVSSSSASSSSDSSSAGGDDSYSSSTVVSVKTDELTANIDFVESFIGRIVRMKSSLKGVSPVICDNARLMLVCQVVHFHILRAMSSKGGASDTDGDVSMADQSIKMADSTKPFAVQMLEIKESLRGIDSDLNAALRGIGKSEISGSLASVYAMYYLVQCEFFKADGKSPLELYTAGIKYLGYAKDIQDPKTWATDLAINALCARSFYDFGELSLHPIMKELKGSWLFELIQAFIDGDLGRYNETMAKFGAEFANEPRLKSERKVLDEKIRLLALVRLAFFKDSTERTIAFSEIAEKSDVPLTEVETLIMRGMSLKLLSGVIDQVSQSISVSFVKPRILDQTEIAQMSRRIDSWQARIQQLDARLGPAIEHIAA